MILEFLKKLWRNKPKSSGVYFTDEEAISTIKLLQKQFEFAQCKGELLETLFGEINSLNDLAAIFYKWAELPEPISDGDRVKALQTWDQLQASHRDALIAYSEIVKIQIELVTMANNYQNFTEKNNEN